MSIASDAAATDDAMSIDAARSSVPAPLSVPESAGSTTSGDENAKRRRRHALSTRLHFVRHSPRYAPPRFPPPPPPLAPLAPHLAVLNHPCPTTNASPSTLARKQEGSAPSYSPALQSWVGGSLAGALKTGGEEGTREVWGTAPPRGGGGGGARRGGGGGGAGGGRGVCKRHRRRMMERVRCWRNRKGGNEANAKGGCRIGPGSGSSNTGCNSVAIPVTLTSTRHKWVAPTAASGFRGSRRVPFAERFSDAGHSSVRVGTSNKS